MSHNVFSGLKLIDLASFIAGPPRQQFSLISALTSSKVEPPGIGPYRYFSGTPPNPIADTNYALAVDKPKMQAKHRLDLKSKDAKEV